MLIRKASLLIPLFLAGIALGGDAIPNWPVPATWAPARASGMVRTMSDVTAPLPFIGITPCRIVDTRGPAGPYGAPALAAGVPRNFALPGGPCSGIPSASGAFSLNITATNTLGAGFILIYPQGGSQPLVSTLNYVAGQTVANAAIVPGSAAGGITVIAGVSGTDLIIDINGYYSGTSTGAAAFSLNNIFSGSAILVDNLSTTCFGSCGILSIVHGDGGTFPTPAIAMRGFAFGPAGVSWGVSGVAATSGDGSTGVFGSDAPEYHPPSSVLTFRAGVQGNSRDAIGVVGQSRNNCVVGQLRNTSDFPTFYGILGATFGTAADATTGPWGVFSGGDFGATGTKHFVEPHPTDPKKVILYSTVEGRTVDTTFRGTARLVNHAAVIEVPEDFRIVTDEEGLTVQITPVGAYSQIYIESQDLNSIVVRGSRDVVFHYQVSGLRRAFKDRAPVQTGYEFMPDSPSARMPGHLTEEARRRLISNGTYNADGTVNLETAEKAGFARIWAEREQRKKAAEAANLAGR